MLQPISYTDFYKTDHRRQYPEGTTCIYSNFTARGSRIKGIDRHVVFGIQYFIKEYLKERFDTGFFDVNKNEAVSMYKRTLDNALGKDAVPVDHIEALHDLGYLPLKIKALPEGSTCPMRVPCLTITNTLDEFFWLTNFIESIMSNVLWGPMTAATLSLEYKKILSSYAHKTGSDLESVKFQAHDFSMRGMMGLEASCMVSASHLLNFVGTDTIPAIAWLEEYYHANSDKELVGCSVPATEHSVMCAGGDMSEYETYKRLLTELYPSGIVSVVSDTWDYWKVITETLEKLKPDIMARDGKLVIRPDSGDPVKIICGDKNALIVGSNESLGSIQLLWNLFGGTVNSKGYKVLDSHIGLIYGDGITLDRCRDILSGLEEKGFASSNVVLGVGSYNYQYVTRDTFGFAMKSTYTEINGKGINIFKDPKTDSGLKKSAKGLLRVDGHELTQEVSWGDEGGDLKTVFYNGRLENPGKLSQIRERLSDYVGACIDD